MKRVIAIACLLVLALAATALADRMDIRKPAYDQVLAYEAQGYSVKDDIQIGELSKGASYYFNTQLTSGLEYFFHFQGDEGVKSVRIVVYDENWDVVAEGMSDSIVSKVSLKPNWTGTFHVKATMVDCQADFDYWFILAGYR